MYINFHILIFSHLLNLHNIHLRKYWKLYKYTNGSSSKTFQIFFQIFIIPRGLIGPTIPVEVFDPVAKTLRVKYITFLA